MNEEITKSISKREARIYFMRIATAIIALKFLTLFIQRSTQVIIRAFSPELYESLVNGPWFLWVLSIAPLYLVGLPVFWAALPKKPLKYQARKLNFGNTVGSCLSCVPLMYIGNIIGLLFVWLLSLILGHPIGNTLTSMINSSPLWVTVLCAVIIAPIGEEFIFRKLLLDRLLPFGETSAILFSGLAFGLFHGNFNQFFYTFFIGVLLAFAYAKTKNLLAPIIMHMFFNFLGGILAPLVLSKLTNLQNPEALAADLTGAIIAIAFFALLIMLFNAGIVLIIIHSIFISKRPRPIPQIDVEGDKGAMWKSPFILASLSLLLLTFALSLR